MTNRKLAITFMLLSALTLGATNPITKLVILDTNGQKYEYAIDKSPKLTFTENQLQVSVSGVDIYFNLDETVRFFYENAALQTDVADIVTDKNYVYSENTLLFPALPANSVIHVYTMNGILVLNKDVIQAGEYALPLTELEAGSYLVNVNGRTIKVLKK